MAAVEKRYRLQLVEEGNPAPLLEWSGLSEKTVREIMTAAAPKLAILRLAADTKRQVTTFIDGLRKALK